MNLVLDTHTFVWLGSDSQRLSKHARQAIKRASRQGALGLASISLWEMAQLAQQGRLLLQGTISDLLTELLARTGVSVIELSPTIAELSTAFGPDFPRDPADRIIAATARAHAATLVTADARIRASALVKTVW